MPLFLAPLQLEDFDTIVRHAEIYSPGDDLVAPPNPVAWPVSTQEDAQIRLRFVMNKQKRRFLEDSTARYIKVVDAPTAEAVDSGDIISMARWHFYPSGYDYASMSHWEKAECIAGEDWPIGFQHELHDFILLERDRAREIWIGVGKPVWILTHLVTRQSQRGRGAAGMLINWGIEQSKKSGIPIYLEAGTQGRPIYERYGFQQVGNSRCLKLQDFGFAVNFELVNMVRWSERSLDKNSGRQGQGPATIAV